MTVTEQKRDQWKVHAHIGLDLGASSINSHATQLAQQFIRDQVDSDNVDDALLTFEHTTFEYFEKPMLHEGSREILYDNYRKLPRAVCENIRVVFRNWVNEVLDAIAAFFGKHNAKVSTTDHRKPKTKRIAGDTHDWRWFQVEAAARGMRTKESGRGGVGTQSRFHSSADRVSDFGAPWLHEDR